MSEQNIEYQNYDKIILQKIKKELLDENALDNSLDENKINLYDVWKVISKRDKKIKEEYKLIENEIDRILNRNFNSKLFDVYLYHYIERDTIRICVEKENGYSVDFADFTFKQAEEGDIYISKSNKKGSSYSIDESKLLMEIGSEIKKLFEIRAKKRRDWMEYCFNIGGSSNLFRIDIDDSMVCIYTVDNLLSIKLESNGKVEINCNSLDILSCIKGHEYELFKKIYVYIDTCPRHIRKQLYDLRKNELNNLNNPEPKTIGYKIKTFVKKYLN